MADIITMVLAIGKVIDWLGDILELFMKEPTIYFVAVALAGAIAGVGRKFVPLKRR